MTTRTLIMKATLVANKATPLSTSLGTMNVTLNPVSPVYNLGYTFAGTERVGSSYGHSSTLVSYNADGTAKNSSTFNNVAGRSTSAGAGAGGNAVFFGGTYYDTATTVKVQNWTTVFNSNFAVYKTDKNVGQERGCVGGANMGFEAFFYGGSTTTIYAGKVNTLSRLNKEGDLVTAETAVGNNLFYSVGGGFSAAEVAMFVTGADTDKYSNKATRLSKSGTFLTNDATLATARQGGAGAMVGDKLFVYGGHTTDTINTSGINNLARFNSDGTLVSSETSLGTAKTGMGGTCVSNNAIFAGGYSGGGYTNTVTVINNSGNLVSVDTSLSVINPTYCLAGASI